MKIEINTKTLVSYNITADQYVLLHLLYYKDFETIKSIFTKQEVVSKINSITNYHQLFLNQELKIEDIILSKKEVEEVLGLKRDNINFWEFYNEYPVRVGSRILRSSGPDTIQAKKHEKKYLEKVKTIEQHELAIKAIKVYVSSKKREGKLQFLEMMETVLNNALWESWKVLIDKKGEENGNWNTEII